MLNDKGLKKLQLALQGNPALALEVVQLIAYTIQNDDDLRRYLGKVKASERRNAYESIKPHLAFEPKPLHHYETANAEWAERHQLPTLDNETGALHAFKVGEVGLTQAAENALYDGGIAVMTCRRCTVEEVFRADTPAGARIKAVQSGWKYETELEKWLCSGCNDAAKEN